MKARLIEALHIVSSDRHKLVILLGAHGAGKTAILKQVAQEMEGEYLNLNLCLADELLALPRSRYHDGVTVNGLIDILCDKLSPDQRLLCVDNVEILFSPELGKVNPVDTFKRVARQRPVLLALPARKQGASAEYSLLGRQDYMSIPLEGYTVIEL